MSSEQCGEVCGYPMEPSQLPISDPVSAAEASKLGPEPGAEAIAWRDELAARLHRYRARRKVPPPRYPSLNLPFKPLEPAPRIIPTEPAIFPAFESISNHALAWDDRYDHRYDDRHTDRHLEAPATEETPAETDAPTDPPKLQARGAKIIEFPRFAWGPPPPPPDQLAEPVFDRPRILEVPEVAPPPPALGGITIEAAQRQEQEKRQGIDIPLETAPLGLRIVAALIDCLILAVASALFGFIFWKVAAIRPPRIQMIGLTAGMTGLFWAIYQYLLIAYAGSTPGLRAAGLELTRFDGSATTRKLRRWRVLASFLSAASLGMGYIWVLLDEDSLCWHDRITHSYLAPKKPAAGA